MIFESQICFSFDLIRNWLINLSPMDVTVTTRDAEMRLRAWRSGSKDHKACSSSSRNIPLDIYRIMPQSRLN